MKLALKLLYQPPFSKRRKQNATQWQVSHTVFCGKPFTIHCITNGIIISEDFMVSCWVTFDIRLTIVSMLPAHQSVQLWHVMCLHTFQGNEKYTLSPPRPPPPVLPETVTDSKPFTCSTGYTEATGRSPVSRWQQTTSCKPAAHRVTHKYKHNFRHQVLFFHTPLFLHIMLHCNTPSHYKYRYIAIDLSLPYLKYIRCLLGHQFWSF